MDNTASVAETKHLAIAKTRGATLVTLDKTLLKAAGGFKVAHKTLPAS